MAVLVGCAVLFGYGVGVGFYRWPPFFAIKKAQDVLIDGWKTRGLDGETALLRSAFTDRLIEGEQINPPITSLSGIDEANRSMLLPVEGLFEAYDQLRVIDAARIVLDHGDTRVLKVAYELDGNRYDAYAYTTAPAKSGRAAALVIPGTGLNQSSAIYRNDSSNYHFGIIEALGTAAEGFVLIKPNEDCIAFHDGKGKLNQGFFLNWLLNRGGSYSAHYVANSLAITKYLQEEYEKVAVVGLSQGGYATLLNALQSQPDAAIVASGFSVLNARDMGARHDQIVIPGLQERLSVDDIRSRMHALTTTFLFTYGKKEGGAYRIEASERRTCAYFASLPNVECKIHEEGHRFPVAAIREFLGRTLESSGDGIR